METKTIEKLNREAGFNYLGNPDYLQKFSNLRFTPAGFARLWYTVGYLHSAIESGEEGATRILSELEQYLNNLNGYGGEVSEENKNPSYRVVLSDDGCWGSFSLSWYRCIPAKSFLEYRHEKNCIYEQAIKWLKIDEDLKLWTSDGYDHYAYAFNGGLILHFDHDDVLSGSYGIHT